jgi:hypothetical protein
MGPGHRLRDKPIHLSTYPGNLGEKADQSGNAPVQRIYLSRRSPAAAGRRRNDFDCSDPVFSGNLKAYAGIGFNRDHWGVDLSWLEQALQRTLCRGEGNNYI